MSEINKEKMLEFLKLGKELFDLMDIYSPDNEIVVGVTFSNSQEYIDMVSNLENK